MKVKTMFIGSGEFAVPILDSLLKNDLIEIVCVVTQPSKPVGRKQILTPTPVGEFLQKNSIKLTLETPAKIRLDAQHLLDSYNPELVIVASYGQIIPEILLEQPKFKALNIHGSLLPDLRGAVPVQMAILNGYNKTGVTIQRMVYEMDAGPIVAKRELDLSKNETTSILMDKLANLGSELLNQVLPKYIAGEIVEEVQNAMDATYCYKQDISKQKAEITFNTDIDLAERMIRAFNPWPVAWLNYKGSMLKIFSAVKSDLNTPNTDFKIIRKDKKLLLLLSNGSLELLELQLEGKMRDEYKNYFYLAE
jgi:methionyl-tRNA formyltransferase